MSSRLISAVLIVALTLQALVIAPAALASSAESQLTPHSEPCPYDSSQSNQDCPCCPDNAEMAVGCMTFCSAFAMVSTQTLLVIQSAPSAAIPFIAPSSPTRTYAPPNPPPIV